MMNKVWIDGLCNECGCLVIERQCIGDFDYENTCTNPKCSNYGWHGIYDTEEVDYYNHTPDITIPISKGVE